MGLLFLRLVAHRCCECYMSCVLWGVAISCGARQLLARLCLAAYCDVCTRCGAALGSVFRAPACVNGSFVDGRGIWLRQEGNLRDEPQARRQRLPAAAEACDVVLRARGQDSSISQLAEEQM